MLAYLICDQRGGLERLVVVQRGVRRALRSSRTARSTTTTRQDRQADAGALYYNAPYLVTAYTSVGEAYRSDRWACFQPQPDPGGILLFQYGIRNYLSIRPADEAGDCDGVATALGAVARRAPAAAVAPRTTAPAPRPGRRRLLLAALVVGGGVFAMRRRATAADRE